MITEKYLLNLWHGTYKRREHWRITFLKMDIKLFLLCFNVLSLNRGTLVICNGPCHLRSAFKNDLAFDYHMIIRMVIILKWNPSQSKAIENCYVCSGNYISCLLLFAYFLELDLLKLLNWIPFFISFWGNLLH